LKVLENFKLLNTLGNFEALWCGIVKEMFLWDSLTLSPEVLESKTLLPTDL
jgi:hypothetical protein